MSSLLWKLPLVVILALLAAAANLVTHVRARVAAATPIQLAPALRPPPDGLTRAKHAARHAAEIEALRAAVEAFNEAEGRAPQSLTELAATGYLRGAHAPANLRQFRYDPVTMTVTPANR